MNFKKVFNIKKFIAAGAVTMLILPALSCFDMYGGLINNSELRIGIFLTNTAVGNQLFTINGEGFPVYRSDLLTSSLPVAIYNKATTLDYDKDGDCDIVVVSDDIDSLYILYNDGSGNFQSYTAVSGLGLSTVRDMDAADLDNDGKKELIICDSGSFTTIYKDSALPVQLASQDFVVTHGDVNGDGVTDVYLSDNSGTDNQILLGLKPDGSFSGSIDLSVTDDTTYGIVICDVNSDGNNDIVRISNALNAFEVYKNSGGGIFSGSTEFTTGISFPLSVVPGDVDGDGDTDFIVGRSSGNGGDILVNNGNFLFSVRHIATDIEYCRLFDVDFDGDLDIIGISTGTMVILKNNGFGDYSLFSTTGISSATGISIFTYEED